MADNESVPHPRHRVFAALYDRITSSDEKVMRPLRVLAAGGATGRVLELGCGTGQNLLHYDWAGVESLDATEPDPFMLRRARARLEKLAPEARAKVTMQEAPAEALPFADHSFDTVVVTLVLCTVADVDRSLRELRRVLRPGGELRVVEHVKGTGRAARFQRIVQPVYGLISAGCKLSRETEAALADHGFALEVSQRLTLGGPLWPTFAGVATIAEREAD